VRIAKQYQIGQAAGRPEDMEPPHRNLCYVWCRQEGDEGIAYAANGYVVAAVPCSDVDGAAFRASTFHPARRGVRGDGDVTVEPATLPDGPTEPPLPGLMRNLRGKMHGRAIIAVDVDLLRRAAAAIGTTHVVLTIGRPTDPILVEPREVGVEPNESPTAPYALVMPMLAAPAWYKARLAKRTKRADATEGAR
jgi:hypothetical protein